MKKVFIFVALFAVAAAAYAISVNPASNVLGDSANTALTIIYRDANGDFSAGNITATTLATTGAFKPTSKTVAQLQAIVPAIGDFYFCSNCSPVKVVIATGTSAGNFADAVGTVFK